MFLCPLLKISLGIPYLKSSWPYKTFYCRCRYEKKSKNLVLPPRKALFWHTVQKYLNFFCLHQKDFLTNPSWKYFLISLRFWEPMGTNTKNEEKYKFHIWSVWYRNSVKRVCGVHFCRHFWKIFKNKDFCLDFFKKG